MAMTESLSGVPPVVKAAPPVAVTGATLFGVPVNDLVLYVTLAYTTLMATHFVWKWAWEVIDRKREEKARARCHRRRATDRTEES